MTHVIQKYVKLRATMTYKPDSPSEESLKIKNSMEIIEIAMDSAVMMGLILSIFSPNVLGPGMFGMVLKQKVRHFCLVVDSQFRSTLPCRKLCSKFKLQERRPVRAGHPKFCMVFQCGPVHELGSQIGW